MKDIHFRKQRELGQIISDTFVFLRRSAKPLLSVLVRTCSIPFIILIVAVGYYTNVSAGSNFLTTFSGTADIAEFVIALIGLALAGIIFNALLYGSTSVFVKHYIAQNQNPEVSVVVQHIKDKTSSILGLGFANLLIILAVAFLPAAIGGFLFASGAETLGILLIFLVIFPLLFVYVKLSVIFPALIDRDLSIQESIKESWKLVKDEWWMTFITIFIIALLIGVIGFVFQIPVVIYTIIKTVTSVQSGTMGDPEAFFDTTYLVLQVIGSSMNYILYTILAIALNFIYYNLNERKNQSGSLDQIDTIGASDV